MSSRDYKFLAGVVAILIAGMIALFVYVYGIVIPQEGLAHKIACEKRGLNSASVSEQSGEISTVLHFCVDKEKRVYWIE